MSSNTTETAETSDTRVVQIGPFMKSILDAIERGDIESDIYDDSNDDIIEDITSILEGFEDDSDSSDLSNDDYDHYRMDDDDMFDDEARGWFDNDD